MSKLIYFSVFLLIGVFVTKSVGVGEEIIDTVEKAVIKEMMTNCSIGKIITFQDYNSLKLLARLKMNSVYLKHYTESDLDVYFLLNAHEGISASPKYNRSLPMVILIHGYFGYAYPSNYMAIAEELVKAKLANVFVMDHTIFMTDSYYASSTYVKHIGEALGLMLSKLYKKGIRKFHLIGHSLGAHISGFAGKTFKSKTWKKIDRITGLDPAGPCFTYSKTSQRLTLTDANFVDIIHSDIKTFGIDLKIGHVDHYPDKGENMPGCITATCSHLKCPFYFAESIFNNKFLSVKCSDWETFSRRACSNNPTVNMGYWIPTDTRGKYYLTINSSSPYAKGIDGIKPPQA